MRPARSVLAQALREARQTTGLTQRELGQQLGLKGRAIYRWERDDDIPSDANLRRVVQIIASLHEAAATKLSLAMATQAPAPSAAPTTTPPLAVAPRALVEHGLFSMADELDLPARRVRGALARWLRRVREAGVELDVVRRELETWISVVH
jgi:transcriptional regulator with XRE-family HTH domain